MVTLETIPLFRHLKPAEFQALHLIVQERKLAAGQEIFHEGTPGDGVYFVKDGLVEIFSDKGGHRIFSRLGPGEIFGEMAVIDLQPRSATASAAQASEVYFVPRDKMLAFIERSPALAFALLQQISQRLREFNLQHLREILESERLAAVGNFARSIVHDLKNPLSIIGLSVGMLSNSSLNPESRAQILSRASRQVQRINNLVSDILTFTDSRRDAGLQKGNFRAFIRQLAAELQSDLSVGPIQFVLENDPPDVSIFFNPNRLARVIQNLVQNAAEFLEDGGTVFLRFKPGTDEIVVEVEDTGPGIAPEIAGKLFQPFATHGKARGTGLGLSICKKIVADHGGEISARSEAGRGAIFSFTLPLAK